jgi:hypothetical protein
MKVRETYHKTFTKDHTFATEDDARALTRAAQRDNEASGGCCSGPGSSGSDYLRDKFEKDAAKFKDPNVRSIILGFLHEGFQGVNRHGQIITKDQGIPKN